MTVHLANSKCVLSWHLFLSATFIFRGWLHTDGLFSLSSAIFVGFRLGLHLKKYSQKLVFSLVGTCLDFTCKFIHFAYGSGVGFIYDVFVRTKAILANHSHASYEGRALGDIGWLSRCPHHMLRSSVCLSNVGESSCLLAENNVRTQFTSFISQHKISEISTWFNNPREQRGFSPQRG